MIVVKFQIILVKSELTSINQTYTWELKLSAIALLPLESKYLKLGEGGERNINGQYFFFDPFAGYAVMKCHILIKSLLVVFLKPNSSVVETLMLTVEGPTWEEAEANANKLGGHLVTINDARRTIDLFKF